VEPGLIWRGLLMCNLKKLYRELTSAGVILGASLGLGATAAFA